jgi:hypothetical protein
MWRSTGILMCERFVRREEGILRKLLELPRRGGTINFPSLVYLASIGERRAREPVEKNVRRE